MRIVVLDGYTLNPGDLSWAALAALGDAAFYDRSPPEEIVPRARDAEIVLINKAVLTAQRLAELPRLRYVGVLATGYNVVDVAEAARRGIVVTNVPAYGGPAVSQMAFAHILNLTNRVADHARGVSAGRWSAATDWCYWDHPLVELTGLTLGVVGLGQIGRSTARIARAFGMRVIAYSEPAFESTAEVEAVGLDELFRQSDVVSLHCPLTPDNARMVDARRLALMKPTALLINTSRGGLIDEGALVEALQAGRIAGAGLDVLMQEPPATDNPLLHLPNCIVTPHISWATRAARQRLLEIAVENVRAFLAGQPRNVVTAK